VEGIIVDPTGKPRRKAVKKAVHSKNYYESACNLNSLLLNNTTDSILLFDFEGNIIYANETWCQVYGYRKEELPGVNLFRQIVDADSHKLDDHFREIKEKGYASFESLDFRKDGSEVPVEVRVRTIEFEGKNLLLSVVRDIAERKKAESELRLKEQILDKASDAIILRNTEGKIVYANEQAYKSRGYTKEEYIGMDVHRLLPRERAKTSEQKMKEALEKGSITFESVFTHKNGTQTPAEFAMNTIAIDDKTFVLSVIRDITERKKAESELRLKEQLLDKSSDSIIIRDADAKIVYANETAYKSRGFTKEEFLGMTIYQLLAPDQAELIKARSKDMLRPGTDTFESTHIRKDGSQIAVEVNRNILEIDGKMYSVTITRDITERKQAEKELRLKELIIDSASDSIILREGDGKIVYVNEVAYKSRGYTKDEFFGLSPYQLVPPDEAKNVERMKEKTLKEGAVFYETKGIRKDGSIFPVEVELRLIEPGGKKLILSVIHDVTERKKAEAELLLEQQILDSATDSILLRDAGGRIIYANEIAYKSLGYTKEELLNMNVQQLLVPEEARLVSVRSKDMLSRGTIIFESTLVRKDGSQIPVEVKSSSIESGGKQFFIAVNRDITQHKEMEEYIKQLAYYDALTGLPNRALFNDRFALAQEHAARYQHLLGLMMMDLDRFKEINDSMGHEAGDSLLKEVASRLVSSMRKIDTVSRMGGDEFVLLMPEMNREEDIITIVQRMLEAFQKPFVIRNSEITVTFSLGIALYPYDGRDLDSLVRNADIAMYQVKKRGRNGYLRYTPDMGIKNPV